MDTIDDEITALKARWAAEEEERKERQAQAQLAHLEKTRDSLRSGEWEARHICRCNRCLRAILSCDPTLVCEQGARGENWWGNGPLQPLPSKPL